MDYQRPYELPLGVDGLSLEHEGMQASYTDRPGYQGSLGAGSEGISPVQAVTRHPTIDTKLEDPR